MSSNSDSVDVSAIAFLKRELLAGNDVENNARALIQLALTGENVDVVVKLAKRPSGRFRVTLEEDAQPSVTVTSDIHIDVDGATDPSRVAKLVLAEFQKLSAPKRITDTCADGRTRSMAVEPQ